MSDQQTAPLRTELRHNTWHIEDANKMPPTEDAALLWNSLNHTPVLTPDGGHQITLGEFNKVSGYATIKCINKGTHVVVHFMGLIPNGVYTMWTETFKSPGWNGTFDNEVAEGAMGALRTEVRMLSWLLPPALLHFQ